MEGVPLSNDGPRYQVREYKLADPDVVDTMTLDVWNRHAVVAECADLETAEKIALALNRTADT